MSLYGATERYVSNGIPLTPYEQELLIILMEECAEVVQAASKLIRFGKKNRPSPDAYENTHYLGLEIGDVQEVVERLVNADVITSLSIADGMVRKAKRLERFLQTDPT